MDSVMKNFLASGRTLITDTLAPKSELPKVPKKKIEPEQILGSPLEMLIKRVKDEKISKMEIIEVFQKIIDQEEAKI